MRVEKYTVSMAVTNFYNDVCKYHYLENINRANLLKLLKEISTI